MRRIAVVALALAAFAACGDDDEAAPVSTSTTATTAPVTTSTTATTAPPSIPTEPQAYAEAFVAAWAAGDRARAEELGTDDAVAAIFAFEGGGDWQVTSCEGAAGSSYCTFSAGGDPAVVVRVGNEAASLGQPQAVIEVQVQAP